MRTKIKLISEDFLNKVTTIKGWIRSVRTSKNVTFIIVNDGSTLAGLQIVADEQTHNYASSIAQLTNGAAISVQGTIVKSLGQEQAVELKAQEITLIGTVSITKKAPFFRIFTHHSAPTPSDQYPRRCLTRT